MSRGRHRSTSVRRPWRLRTAGLGGLVLVTVAALGAATPVPSGGATGAELAPETLSSAPAELVDGREDAVAGRDELRAPLRATPERIEPAEATVVVPPLPEVVGQLWVVEAVNVRSGPSADTERLTTLAFGDQIDVTGYTSDGWTQVIWQEQAAWVNAAYLAAEEPVAPSPAAGGVSSAACSTSPEVEGYLQANAAAAYRAVCAAFPGVASSYGGYRSGDGGDHGSGHALDIMVSGSAGWDIVAYLQAHAGELGITYLIYQQQIWMAGDAAGSWETMADRGSATANHYDHVHVSTS